MQQLAGLQQEDRPDDYNDFVEGSAAESSESFVFIHVWHLSLHTAPTLACVAADMSRPDGQVINPASAPSRST